MFTARISPRVVPVSSLYPNTLSRYSYFHRILNAFLNKTYGSSGPLKYVADQTSFVDQSRLHFMLLSYYRILQANRTLPKHFLWPVSTLAKVFTIPESDSGSRLLAIRCYFLQSGMGEAERINLEHRYVGDVGTVDCPISYSVNTDGSIYVLDGWVLPAVEATRIAGFWKSSAEGIPDYYCETEGRVEPFSETDLRWVIVCLCHTFFQIKI